MRRAFIAVLLSASTVWAQRLETKISLEVQRADLQSVLRLFANAAKLNVIFDEHVEGTVTLTLRNVTLRQAFNAVLAARGLGVERYDGIVRIAPASVLEAESLARARVTEAAQREAPLTTRLIPVSYANASELAPQVRQTLSPRGTVSVDTRTNTLIIRDVER